eukprot:CAMPEP_0177532932 /NCGR_PEP_ID=MMETSP0369-20130122/54987_1 /TAXON_ID=447022 ORGANISM="Scrippsiella hangoei-like, Strain SHHI-4" /NCGR_SAMPLE_ID=MMETSP0369 /ASSEMBLY_ACC=CAM_ASM_000364 /LENGTH=36 /DNA_ID= /DNA_START= /DNA_END= /DNA_ORIENTATION=
MTLTALRLPPTTFILRALSDSPRCGCTPCVTPGNWP